MREIIHLNEEKVMLELSELVRQSADKEFLHDHMAPSHHSAAASAENSAQPAACITSILQ